MTIGDKSAVGQRASRLRHSDMLHLLRRAYGYETGEHRQSGTAVAEATVVKADSFHSRLKKCPLRRSVTAARSVQNGRITDAPPGLRRTALGRNRLPNKAGYKSRRTPSHPPLRDQPPGPGDEDRLADAPAASSRRRASSASVLTPARWALTPASGASNGSLFLAIASLSAGT